MPLSCIYLIQCFSNENFDMFNFDLICVLVKRDCSCCQNSKGSTLLLCPTQCLLYTIFWQWSVLAIVFIVIKLRKICILSDKLLRSPSSGWANGQFTWNLLFYLIQCLLFKSKYVWRIQGKKKGEVLCAVKKKSVWSEVNRRGFRCFRIKD